MLRLDYELAKTSFKKVCPHTHACMSSRGGGGAGCMHACMRTPPPSPREWMGALSIYLTHPCTTAACERMAAGQGSGRAPAAGGLDGGESLPEQGGGWAGESIFSHSSVHAWRLPLPSPNQTNRSISTSMSKPGQLSSPHLSAHSHSPIHLSTSTLPGVEAPALELELRRAQGRRPRRVPRRRLPHRQGGRRRRGWRLLCLCTALALSAEMMCDGGVLYERPLL